MLYMSVYNPYKAILASTLITVGSWSLSSISLRADFASAQYEAGYSVIGRGPNDKTWGKVTWQTNKLGIASAITNLGVIEVASGMHYRSGEQWIESRDLIELTDDGGATATHGPCQAYFHPNINSEGGAVTLVTSSNRTFATRPIGLFLSDSSTGKAVRIATVRDCVAELLPPNQIVWKDFLDNVRADLRITYTKAAIESDLILLEKPPFAPEDYGMDPARTTLELWHWWNAPAAPEITTVPISTSKTDTESFDSFLHFGDFFFPGGRAFRVNGSNAPKAEEPAQIWLVADPKTDFVPVKKTWHQRAEKGSLLIESVDWEDAKIYTSDLPSTPQEIGALNKVEDLSTLLDSIEPPQVANGTAQITISKEAYIPEGFVLDYITVPPAPPNNIFDGLQNTATYYISGPCIFDTAVTFGNAVLKFEPTYLSMHGQVTCGVGGSTTIMTTKDDDLYGQKITGSLHSLVQINAWPYSASLPGTGGPIKNLIIRGAYIGINTYQRSIAVTNCTIELCNQDIGVSGGAVAAVDPSTTKRCSITNPWVGQGGVTLTDACAGDSNQNNIPDSWEYLKLGGLVSGSADADGDGVSNVLEYQGGGDGDPATFPVIINQPQRVEVLQGGTVNFSVAGAGSYQWTKGGVPISGATSNKLTVANITTDWDADIQVEVRAPYNSLLIATPVLSDIVRCTVYDQMGWDARNWVIANSSKSQNLWLEWSNGQVHTHPQNWPTNFPQWHRNTNSLLFGMVGLTAISPCNQFEGSSGQIPVTLLTRRHGYARGHSLDPSGVTNKVVFFYDINNIPVPATVIAATNGGGTTGGIDDFTVLLFSPPLPTSIEVMQVAAPPSHWDKQYHIYFSTCQHAEVAANYAPFTHFTGEDGDSGSPNMLLQTLGSTRSLVFVRGTTTATINVNPNLIQAAMDKLCTDRGLTPQAMSWAW